MPLFSAAIRLRHMLSPATPPAGQTALYPKADGLIYTKSPAGEEKALADKNYIQSRATDLVTNGTGALGDNTNFSSFTFSKADAPEGAVGAFRSSSYSSTQFSDEMIPVDPSKAYKFSLQVKQLTAGNAARMYAGLVPVDAYGSTIIPHNYMYTPNTQTTLAVALNPGDTTVTLTNSTNWYGLAAKPAGASSHLRTLLFWDYVDPGGKAWPIGSFSRNYLSDAYADGGITGNVITLRVPYAGPAKSAGTSLSNGMSGGNYMYGAITNLVVPQTWTSYSEIMPAAIAPGGLVGSFLYGWPPGTAQAKLVFLMNRDVAGSVQAIAMVSLSDAGAAQSTANLARTESVTIGRLPVAASGVSSSSQVVRADDSRLTDTRAPIGAAGGDLSGTYPNPTIGQLRINHGHVAAANKDGNAATASMRTLGTGANQAAAGNHKAHQWTNGEYRYQTYEQEGTMRLYIDHAAFSVVRFRPIQTVEFWDYSLGTPAWVPWVGGDAILKPLLDGNEDTAVNVDHAHRRFRFVVSPSSTYPALAIVLLQSTWTGFAATPATVILESSTSAGGTYTLRDTSVFNSTNTNGNYGWHMKATSAMHTGNAWWRVEIDITDWVDQPGYTTWPLRRFEVASGYQGLPRGLPFTWDYDRSLAVAGPNVTAGGVALVKTNDSRLTDARTPTTHTHTLLDLPDAWVKRSVRAATTANITLSGTQTIDTVALVAGDRVLVKNQTTTSQNGLYDVASGAWTRTAGANTSAEVAGATLNVDQGAQAGQMWTTTFASTATLGTTAMLWYRVLDSSGGSVSSLSVNASLTLMGTPVVTTDDSRLTNSRTPLAHTHLAADLGSSGTRSPSTFLRGDNVWATPTDTNTTYSAQSQAEAENSADTTARLVTGQRLYQAITKWARPISWVPSWNDVTSKPSTFTPETHTHIASQITDMQLEAAKVVERVTGEGAALKNARALDAWKSAVQSRHTSRANVLIIGDSISEGAGGTSWAGRPSVALQTELRKAYPIQAKQAVGYVPAVNYSGYATPGLSVTGTPASGTDYGYGRKALGLFSTTTATYTFTGTKIRVYYGWNNDFSTAQATLTLDGGAGVALPVAPDATTGSGQYWESGVLADTSHTLTIVGSQTGIPHWIEGFEVFGSADDVTEGVHVYDSAHGGYASNMFVPALSAGADRMWQAIDLNPPNLTIIHLGTNDTAWDFTAANVLSWMTTICNRIATAAAGQPYSILVVLPYKSVRSDAEHAGLLNTYRDALRLLADRNVAVLDLDQFWPRLTAGQGTESGLMWEDDYPVHPNQAGHDYIVQIYKNLATGGRDDTGWINATLENSFLAFGFGTWDMPAFWRLDGEVQLAGLMSRASSSTAACLTLPPGFRPLMNKMFTAQLGGNLTARVDVNANGTVMFSDGLPNVTMISLAGIKFRAEQ